MTPEVAAEMWIASTLTEDALKAPVRKFRALVGTGVPLPCVVWSWQDAGQDERGGKRVHIRPILQVKVLTKLGTAEDESTRLLAAIETLLQDQDASIGGGLYQLHCHRFGAIPSYLEDQSTPEGSTILHEGALWQFIVGPAYS